MELESHLLTINMEKELEHSQMYLQTELPKLTTPRIEDWSDHHLLTLRTRVKFSSFPMDQCSRFNVYYRFYVFYFHGIVDPEDNVVGIMADAAALAETLKGPIWFKNEVNGELFHPLNYSNNYNNLSNLDNLPLAEVGFSLSTMKKKQKYVYKDHLLPYNAQTAKTFKALIVSILAEYNPKSSRATSQEKRLQRMTGFLALTLWRASIENKEQLRNAFLEDQYRINLSTLADWSYELPFSPPCEQCILICTKSLIKGTVGVSSMFIILAAEYVKSRRNSYVDKCVTKYLSASVLSHTALHGLGILQMMKQACLITGKKWTELYELSYLNSTAKSWQLIYLFFCSYVKKTNVQFGFNWARIINDGYLQNYSPEENLCLAGIFAGIIEQSQGPDIWATEWAKPHVKNLKDMREYGITLYQMSFSIKKVTAAAKSIIPLQLTRERLQRTGKEYEMEAEMD